MWGRTEAAEAWNVASFPSKLENRQGEGEKKNKTLKIWKSGLTKMIKLVFCGFLLLLFFKSRTLVIIRHSEVQIEGLESRL